MIKIYTGPMFGGKSFHLIEDYEYLTGLKSDNAPHKTLSQDEVIAFKPTLDTRDKNYIKSRGTTTKIKATQINDLNEIENHLSNEKAVFMDEFNFFKGDVSVIFNLDLYHDIDFYISGLSKTAKGVPFGLMPDIMAIADNITFYPAVCSYCGKEAYYSHYLGEKSLNEIVIGDSDYVALCKNCYKKAIKNK